MTMDDILDAYSREEITIEEANEKLKDIGCPLTLDEDKEGAGWTDKEMEEGFLPPVKENNSLHEIDFTRRPELANKKVYQLVRGTYYTVFYDSEGYARRAKKGKV